MHAISFFLTLTLFLFTTSSSAQAHRKETGSSHQTVARSIDLSLRQYTEEQYECAELCAVVKEKLNGPCRYSDACGCSLEFSAPFHDCAECVYRIAPDASSKAQLNDKYNEYLDGCASDGYTVEGDTILTDEPSIASGQPSASTTTPSRISSTTLFRSSSTASSIPSASASGLSSSSLSSTPSESNNAAGLSHGSLFGVGLFAAIITTFACLL